MKIALPTVVGADPSKPPLMACYISNSGSATYYAVSSTLDSPTDPYCGVTLQSDGRYHAFMYQMVSGEQATFVLDYY